MSNCIVTYVSGDDFEKQLDVSLGRINAYAKKCNAELIVLRGKTDNPNREIDKYKASTVFERYDLSLFLDVDIIVSKNAPNIFEQVPKDKISAFNEYPSLQYFKWFWDFNKPKEVRQSQALEDVSQNVIINSGMFVIPRELSHLYGYPEFSPLPIRGFEQSLFSCRIQDAGVLNELDLKWNCIWNHPDFHEVSKKAYFVHFNFKPIKRRIELMKIWNEKPNF